MSIFKKISICHECICLSEFVDLISSHGINKSQSLHDAIYLDLELSISQNQGPALYFGYKNELDDARTEFGLAPFKLPSQSVELKMFTRIYECTVIHASTPVNVIFGALLAFSLEISENNLGNIYVKYNVSNESFLVGTKQSINRLERYNRLSDHKKTWFRRCYPERGLMNMICTLPANAFLAVVLILAGVGSFELAHFTQQFKKEASVIQTNAEPCSLASLGENNA